MAIVGAITLARRATFLSPNVRIVPGAQVLSKSAVNAELEPGVDDLEPIETNTTDEAARVLGLEDAPRVKDEG